MIKKQARVRQEFFFMLELRERFLSLKRISERIDSQLIDITVKNKLMAVVVAFDFNCRR